MSTTKPSGREVTLGKIRSALGSGADDTSRREVVEARLAKQTAHLIPERVQRGKGQLAQLFRGFLEGQSATVIEVSSPEDVPAAVARYLRESNLPACVRLGDDPFLQALPWSHVPQLERQTGRAGAADEVGLTHASAGIAETGTLLFVSGAENPVTLNYMPETNIAVIQVSDIVDAYETAWARLRARLGKGVMPRTVNFISGPSRTGDIGGKLTMGAHGPRRMCVIMVQGA